MSHSAQWRSLEKRQTGAGAPARVDDVHVHPPASDLQRRLDRLHHPGTLGTRHPDAVLDDLQHASVSRVDARVTLPLEELEDLGLAEVLRHLDREREDEPRVARLGGAARELVEDRVRRVAADRAAAAAAVELRRAREEELQVVVQLRHRADGRARRADRIRLVDRDRREAAFDPVDLRLVHPVEELPRVRREGLDVAPLAFRVQRVEHQGGLAGAGHAGHDDQLAGGDRDVEVLEVVLSRAVDGDRFVRGAMLHVLWG